MGPYNWTREAGRLYTLNKNTGVETYLPLTRKVSGSGQGNQTTYSWRTGRSLGPDGSKDLTGPEMRKIILQGGDPGDQGTRNSQVDKGSSPYDNGHEFSTLSIETTRFRDDFNHGFRVSSTRDSLLTRERLEWNGSAPVYSSLTPTRDPTMATATRSKRLSNGSTLVNRSAPTAPEAGLATFLGELREGLPSLTGTILAKKGLSSKAVGGEYLNFQFSIMPIISDIRKMAQSVLDMNKLLAQYKRDSGRLVRRRATLENSSENKIVSIISKPGLRWAANNDSYDLRPFLDQSSSQLVILDEFTTRIWFSGGYVYHVPPLTSGMADKFLHYESLANKLLGTRLNPEMVWELTPWSWLIDWFSNVGDVISNITRFSEDSLVMKYGYVMHSYSAERTFLISGLRTLNGTSIPPSVGTPNRRIAKYRDRATPYGFGTDLSSLTPERWAILAALGMTKSPKNLRFAE